MKIVYVVVSGKDSIYLAQAYASAWSLKYHNPDVSITLVMDNKTSAVWDNCGFEEFKSMVNHVIKVDFDDSVKNHERSRYLKTSLRKLIEGDFLFIDTDTIITDSLSKLDDIKCDVGAVVDGHRYIDAVPLFKFIRNWLKKYYQINNVLPNINYYNSGVLLVRDTEIASQLFSKWHFYWNKSKEQGFSKDQLPLLAADNSLGGVITPIADIYNYQVSETAKYINDAKITHFLYGNKITDAIHPFYGKDFYRDITLQKGLSDKQKKMILECKSLYNINSRIIAGKDVNIWNSHTFKFLRSINDTIIFKVIDFSSRCFNWGMRICKGEK